MFHLINQQLTGLVELFLPAQCALCGLPSMRNLDKKENESHSCLICSFCQKALIKKRACCQHCALPLPKNQDYCGDCINKGHAFTHIHAIADYIPPYSTLIKKFKYNGQLLNGELLAELLLQSILFNFSKNDIKQIDYLIAVPLHPKKQRTRGFNQAQIIAQRISHSLSIPLITNGITRSKQTVPQEGLSITERKKNLQNAFFFDRKKLPDLLGKRLILIDDVVTTGATANSFCQQLKDQGIEKIDIWCICRTSLKI
jgi:ComF family protein